MTSELRLVGQVAKVNGRPNDKALGRSSCMCPSGGVEAQRAASSTAFVDSERSGTAAWFAGLDLVRTEGDDDRLGSGTRAELAHCVHEVKLDGRLTDVEFCFDSLCRCTGGEQLKYLPFAERQCAYTLESTLDEDGVTSAPAKLGVRP